MPMVSAADLLFKISNDLAWNLFCADLSCYPILLWKDDAPGKSWQNITLTRVRVVDDTKKCFQADNLLTDKVKNIQTYVLEYFIWIPASTCFPWKSKEKFQSDHLGQRWPGSFLNTHFFFLYGEP